jgi:hypothetical protein
MSCPHVAGLWYCLKSAPTRSFSNPPPVERHTDRFYIRLEDGIVTVWMKEHHAARASARQVVEEYLRNWELSAALEYGGRPDIQFEFKRADVVDLAPSPPGTAPASTVELGALTARAGLVTLVTQDPSYPSPPDEFRVSPEVDVLWTLYNQYREKRYPLLPMTYAFVTFYEAHAGGKREAAQRYNVSPKVSKELRKLSSNRGIGAEARKYEGDIRSRLRLSNEEQGWIEQVLRAIIRRVGEVTHDPAKERPRITQECFPKLPLRSAESE